MATVAFAVGIAHVIIGLAVITPHFGLFGIFCTLVALAFTVYHGVNVFSNLGAPLYPADLEGDDRPTGLPQEQQGSRDRAATVWGALSLSAPFVGFIGGVAAAVVAPHFQWGLWGFRVWLGFGVAGLLCGVIALVRTGRPRGLTLAGLMLNTPLVVLLPGLVW